MVHFGVVHGRFQIVHNDHLNYILAASERCKNLVIGITNSDPLHMKSERADPNRSRPEANPLTFFERYCMLRAVLLEAGFKTELFEIVPFPINHPSYIKYYVPAFAKFFFTIYDRWGEEKLKRLKNAGFQTEILWQKDLSQKGITSTMVRKRILEGNDYQNLLPPSAYQMVKDWEIASRLRKINESLKDGVGWQ